MDFLRHQWSIIAELKLTWIVYPLASHAPCLFVCFAHFGNCHELSLQLLPLLLLLWYGVLQWPLTAAWKYQQYSPESVHNEAVNGVKTIASHILACPRLLWLKCCMCNIKLAYTKTRVTIKEISHINWDAKISTSNLECPVADSANTNLVLFTCVLGNACRFEVSEFTCKTWIIQKCMACS